MEKDLTIPGWIDCDVWCKEWEEAGIELPVEISMSFVLPPGAELIFDGEIFEEDGEDVSREEARRIVWGRYRIDRVRNYVIDRKGGTDIDYYVSRIKEDSE